MGFLDDVPVLNEVEDAAGTVATGAADIPADFAHIALEEGRQPVDENLGWAGVFEDAARDAFDATTGTGEDPRPGQDLGIFGEIDRHWDYRSLTGELDPDGDEWADPTDATTGLSGMFHAVAGQSASAGDDAADAANDVATFGFKQILDNPVLLGLTVLAGIYVTGQLVDIDLGGSSA